MRWAAWLLAILGIVFLVAGGWSYASMHVNGDRIVLVEPLLISGAILLAAGIAILAFTGYYCCGECGYGGCGCDHCAGCREGECCGACACAKDDGHEHGGHHGHSH